MTGNVLVEFFQFSNIQRKRTRYSSISSNFGKMLPRLQPGAIILLLASIETLLKEFEMAQSLFNEDSNPCPKSD